MISGMAVETPEDSQQDHRGLASAGTEHRGE